MLENIQYTQFSTRIIYEKDIKVHNHMVELTCFTQYSETTHLSAAEGWFCLNSNQRSLETWLLKDTFWYVCSLSAVTFFILRKKFS